MYIYAFQHIVWLFGFLYFKDMSSETVIRVYLSYVLIAFYPIACTFWNAGNPVVFFWYLLILFGAIVFDRKNVNLWIPWILGIVLSIFFLSSIFPNENITPISTYKLNILTVIATIILASYFALVSMKMADIAESMQNETVRTTEENTENLKRDKALYEAIIKYLEENKPFKNPDFNAQLLAKALNTNINYISRAVNAGGSDDFHALLNKFRIDYVKSMLDSGAINRYTTDYIYTEAGYRHRSTFNAAFKSIMGMTPSDYISQQKINDNS